MSGSKTGRLFKRRLKLVESRVKFSRLQQFDSGMRGEDGFPHRVYILLDAFWFLALAGDTVRSVITGWSPLWLVMAGFQVFLVVTGVRQYRRFTRG